MLLKAAHSRFSFDKCCNADSQEGIVPENGLRSRVKYLDRRDKPSSTQKRDNDQELFRSHVLRRDTFQDERQVA